MQYRVTGRDGQPVHAGDAVTDFRGDSGTFQSVTRGVEHNGTAKVLVSGLEYYDRVWGLTVTTLED